MTEPKFTKGPWEAGTEAYGMNMGGDHRVACDVRAGSRVIARLGGASVKTDPENIYNTYLVAAAPELYAALSAIVEGGGEENLMTNGRAALAKARGETYE